MESRFTVKDFLLLSVLGLVLLVQFIGMYMVDRQWLKMEQMERLIAEQTADMRSLRESLRDVQINASNGIGQAGSAQTSAFERALEATRQPDYAAGDWLVQAFPLGLKTITWPVSSDAYAAELQTYVLESLLSRHPDTLEWQGLLADAWEVSDDGLTYTFRLRSDIRFSDGAPLTADDVVFTFEFIMDPRIAAPRQRAYYEKVEGVRATGPLEVVFKFKEPYFESLSLAGGLPVLPKHFYEPFLKQPEPFNQSKGLLLGSGPYRLRDPKGWTPDQGIVELERNPRYWGPVLPPFERLLWKVIENDSARLTTFRNGDIDVYGARPREYKDLQKDAGITKRAKNLEYMSPVAGYSYIAWNQKRSGKPSIFSDRRVRQALSYLTNRQRIIDEIFLGYGEIAVSPFNPRSRQHDLSIKPLPYDLDKARALLKESGYSDRNGDGVLEDTKNKPFRFELAYLESNEETESMVLFLKDLYAKAGIILEPKPSEWPVMLEMIDKKNFDAITLGWTSGVETDIYQMFHSSQDLSGGDNYVSYRNPELDKLIETARSTIDEDARMPIWQKAERILHEDQPYTFLTRRKSLIFIDERMRNVEVTKLGLNRDFLPVEWYVPKPMQKYTR